MITVAAAQLPLDITDQAGSRDRVLDALDRLAPAADLVVLPELASSGYVFTDSAEALRLAEPLDGPFVTALAERSRRHGCVVVAGLAERDGDRLRNSAVLVEGGELLAVHRKVHAWGTEAAIFTAGDEPVPVVATTIGRVAPLVCYDLEFPELVQSAARRGAQLLAAPVNWPADGAPPTGERPVDVIRAQAMAAMHRVFVVVADRCGVERGQHWVGGSVIVGPDGYPLAGPAAAPVPTELLVELDPALAEDKRLGPHNHVFADRRPAAYG
ncbi:carbon-nitrogen hydrolase [Enemella evansiae]|uniref:nitrilase-related carbon-nitrogen hydrolase n=1 Tax=Enemella evansiae TaxID=2016499 RepID=UPI000B963EF3|nr:nitrilase-related carbon-nitrogen hydrolase [Enemella evansiae]OYN98524.1 carbon-nitrogen hydrolase [Enemella evansiae]